jgi:hypothetical protein
MAGLSSVFPNEVVYGESTSGDTVKHSKNGSCF